MIAFPHLKQEVVKVRCPIGKCPLLPHYPHGPSLLAPASDVNRHMCAMLQRGHRSSGCWAGFADRRMRIKGGGVSSTAPLPLCLTHVEISAQWLSTKLPGWRSTEHRYHLTHSQLAAAPMNKAVDVQWVELLFSSTA